MAGLITDWLQPEALAHGWIEAMLLTGLMIALIGVWFFFYPRIAKLAKRFRLATGVWSNLQRHPGHHDFRSPKPILPLGGQWGLGQSSAPSPVEVQWMESIRLRLGFPRHFYEAAVWPVFWRFRRSVIGALTPPHPSRVQAVSLALEFSLQVLNALHAFSMPPQCPPEEAGKTRPRWYFALWVVALIHARNVLRPLLDGSSQNDPLSLSTDGLYANLSHAEALAWEAIAPPGCEGAITLLSPLDWKRLWESNDEHLLPMQRFVTLTPPSVADWVLEEAPLKAWMEGFFSATCELSKASDLGLSPMRGMASGATSLRLFIVNLAQEFFTVDSLGQRHAAGCLHPVAATGLTTSSAEVVRVDPSMSQVIPAKAVERVNLAPSPSPSSALSSVRATQLAPDEGQEAMNVPKTRQKRPKTLPSSTNTKLKTSVDGATSAGLLTQTPSSIRPPKKSTGTQSKKKDQSTFSKIATISSLFAEEENELTGVSPPLRSVGRREAEDVAPPLAKSGSAVELLAPLEPFAPLEALEPMAPSMTPHPDLARLFLLWMTDRVNTLQLLSNQDGALLYGKGAGMLWVTPIIFRQYLRETKMLKTENEVLRAVLKARWHQKNPSGSNFRTFHWQRDNGQIQTLHGLWVASAKSLFEGVTDCGPRLRAVVS